MTIEEATKIAEDILPWKVLHLHVKDQAARTAAYGVLIGAIFASANKLPFSLSAKYD